MTLTSFIISTDLRVYKRQLQSANTYISLFIFYIVFVCVVFFVINVTLTLSIVYTLKLVRLSSVDSDIKWLHCKCIHFPGVATPWPPRREWDPFRTRPVPLRPKLMPVPLHFT